MADVTEVIHRISYEINDSALANATKAIQLQISELEKLGKQLDGYLNRLNTLSTNEGKALSDLSRQINRINQEVTVNISRIEGMMGQVFKGLMKGFDIEHSLEGAVSKTVRIIKEKFIELELSARSVSSGINRIFTSTSTIQNQGAAKSESAIGRLGKSMLDTTSVINIGITVLGLLGEELLKEGGIIDRFVNKERKVVTETEKIIKGFSDLTDKVSELASEELVNSRLLYETATDVTQAYTERLQAVDELQKRYPEYFGNLSREAILAGKAAGEYLNLNNAIIAHAEIEVYEEELKALVKQHRTLEKKYEQLSKKDLHAFKFSEEELRKYNIPQKIDVRELKHSVALKELEEEKVKNLEAQRDTSEAILEIKKSIKTVERSGDDKQRAKAEEVKSVKNDENSTDGPLNMIPIRQPLLSVTLEPPKLNKVSVPEVEQKGLTKEQKENIEEGIKGYQELAQAAAEAYNSILQVQIDALDKEISLREKRVGEAKKLAERGNTEALRLEEERLRKAQQQREQFARRQQAVNAAITVSNAIAAVARAALEGGGFGSIATIAALIAALAAGYAAVTSLSNDSGDSFADGVIDYKGKGGPRDDKNWVRISTGESVITAEGTKKNRALLEAINKGAALHMVNPALPLMMPEFKLPVANTANGFASTADLKRLEGKLDEVVGAIEDNKMKQNIFFNEQGVGIMTERAIQKDRRRWK